MRMNGGLPIRVVSGNGYSTILTDKREAYTLGNDGLGKGSERRKNVPGVLRTKSGSCNVKKVPVENVTNIAHGIGHSYALNLKGEIYCWGDVNLVHGTTKSANPTNPTKIDRGDSSKVTAVSCGEKHACVLLQNGMLMTMGANDAGQLGTGPIQHDHEHQEKGKVFHFIQHVRRGNNLLNSVRFKEISCGSYHSVAISSGGASLYTWGWGDAGRLGMGNEKMHNQPTCVESLSTLGPFAVVTCGTAQTLVATEGGDVYGFGWNAHGQISGAIKNDQAGASSDSCLLPVLCLKNKGVVKLSCSGFHSAAITLAGDLYMWGKSRRSSGAGAESTTEVPRSDQLFSMIRRAQV